MKSRIDWDAQPWATTTNNELAKQLGVPRSTVIYQRRARGLVNPPSKEEKRDWTKERLGQVSDKQLARELGLSEGTVKQHRAILGILPFRPLATRRITKKAAK